MKIENEINMRLIENLKPESLEIINESHLHAGHAGDDGSGQTHFKIRISAGAFKNKSRIQRHRMVYTLLDDLFKKGLHALYIETRIPDKNP